MDLTYAGQAVAVAATRHAPTIRTYLGEPRALRLADQTGATTFAWRRELIARLTWTDDRGVAHTKDLGQP